MTDALAGFKTQSDSVYILGWECDYTQTEKLQTLL